MILTRDKILAEVQFEPALDVFQVNPHSIDLRLNSDIIIHPGQHQIARSWDKVTLPDNVMAIVYPRSSLNRMLISLDMTGVVDAGYAGQLILPLTNHSMDDFILKRGARIASLIFYRLENKVTPRLSKYHNSDGKLIADKDEEIHLIETGSADALKEVYRL